MNIPEKAIEATYDMLAKRIMNTMKTVAMWVLYEEHGWRSVRLQRFEQQMDKHSEACMSYDRYGQIYVKLSDMAKTMQETCGIHPDMETLETIEKENEKANGKFVSLDAVVEVLEETGHMAKTMQETCGIHPDMETLETIEKENEKANGKFVSLDAVVEVLEETGHGDIAEALKRKIENA